MALLPWDESMIVKIAEFDAQHKKLVAMINQLHDSMIEGRSKEILGKILDDLIDDTAMHFTAEEKIMQEQKYPEFEAHKSEHDKLIATVVKLQSDFRSEKTGVDIDLMNFLKSWLKVHIKETDAQYAPYLHSRGIR